MKPGFSLSVSITPCMHQISPEEEKELVLWLGQTNGHTPPCTLHGHSDALGEGSSDTERVSWCPRRPRLQSPRGREELPPLPVSRNVFMVGHSTVTRFSMPQSHHQMPQDLQPYLDITLKNNSSPLYFDTQSYSAEPVPSSQPQELTA